MAEVVQRSEYLDPMPGETPLDEVTQEWVDAFRLDKSCVERLGALLTQAGLKCAADLMQVCIDEWMSMLGECGLGQDALLSIRISMGSVSKPYTFPSRPLHEAKVKTVGFNAF